MKRYECFPGGTLGLSWAATLFMMLTPASAQSVDFTVTGFGPHHVVQGYDLIFNAGATIISGDGNQMVTPTLSGVPGGTAVHFINMEKSCCGTKLYTITSDNAIRLSTSATTPVGTYNVVITYTTDLGVSRSTTWVVYVDPMPVLARQTGGTYFPPPTPLTMQNQWSVNMLTYGDTYCVPSQVGTWDQLVWYYDGVRNYYQIADATADTKWNACAQMIAGGYQQYVLQNNGSLPGYRIFPRGLSMDYQRSNSTLSYQALQELVASTAVEFTNTAWSVSWYTSREVAYALESQLENEKLGGQPTSMRDDLVTAAIGQVDQWFYSKSADYVQPFMVALTAEALIQYWDTTHDPRIPGTLQAMADGLWANNWNVSCQCFPYQNGPPPAQPTYATDENLLIAPLYGWVYKQTGFSGYRDMGDQIFNAGVSSGWLGTGKFFSMNYRWSGKYVEWRNGTSAATQPMVTITTPTTAATWSASTGSITLGGTASDSQGVTQVTWATDHGGSGTATGTSTWTASGIPLQSGSNQITVTAHDSSGNQASAMLTVTFSAGTTSPTVTITSPTSASTFSTSSTSINLSGTASDSLAISQVTWTTNHGGSGTASGTNTWSANAIALQTGSNLITVTARDSGGNQSSATLTVTVAQAGTTAPTINITSPTAGSTFSTSSSSVNLSGTASDSVGVSQVTWVTNHGASGTATGTTNWTIPGLVLPAGSTGVTVTAHDTAGNVASAILNVTYTPPDSTPPTVHITSPTSGPTFSSSNGSISLSGTASDNVGVTQVTWVADRGGSGIAGGTTNWTINGLLLTSGSTVVTVTAHDAAGNLASAALTVTYTPPDTTPPTITITSPTLGPTFSASSNNLSLSGIASDNVGVTQVSWSTNHGASGIASGTTSWTINGLVLPSGSTQVTVTAGDAAGNAASAVLTITYTAPDTVPPAISITSPTSAATYAATSSTVALAGTASDNVGVIQVTWVTDRGGSGVATGTSAWAINSVPLQNGQNTITVTARDAAGNQATAGLVVTYTAATNAAILITSPTTGSTFHSPQNTIALAGTAPATTTQVTWVTDQGVQGQAFGTGTWGTYAISLQKGSNKITVTARDASGSQTSAQITVVVSKPAIVTSPLPVAKAGKLYSYQLSAVDGIPPYSWSVGSLPNGLEVSGAGTISGTPVTTGTFTLNVAVQDSVDAATSASVNLQVDDWLTLVSGASLTPGPVAPDSMVTAFGWQLAAATASATTSTLPTTLGNAAVKVRDANGVERSAALYYVSPSQINFTIPADTALGPAIASVYNGNQVLATGSLYVAAVSPALFFLNQDGLAAAGLVRVTGDTFDYEPTSRLDTTTNQFVAVPIDLGSDTDQVYLTLYGTGIRGLSSLDSVHVYIGGVLLSAAYAGASGAYDGLDIVNVLLPKELRGKGAADVLLTVNGTSANVVNVLIK